jgi:ABC-type transporter Mla maintaining outer membrane lipid asymmetry permease subunit MlaE
MAVKLPAVVTWVMTMCSFIDSYQGFTEIGASIFSVKLITLHSLRKTTALKNSFELKVSKL